MSNWLNLSDFELGKLLAALYLAGEEELYNKILGETKTDYIDRAFVSAAKKITQNGMRVTDGREIQIDNDAVVSRGDDKVGTYVMAWLWVPADELCNE